MAWNHSDDFNNTLSGHKNFTSTASLDPFNSFLEQIYSLMPNDFAQFISTQVMDPSTKKVIVNEYEDRLCNRTIFSQSYPDDGQLYCNATFDGWGCWNYTLAGTRTYSKCPLFLEYRKPGALAFKDCLEDGSWYRHPISGKIWSDYTPCSDTTEEERLKQIIFVYLSGYSVSILLLLISVIIFSCFRQLKCARVTLHKNLFISFILAAILWILTYSLVALNPEALSSNPVWCKILHVITNCMTMCNYAWMFCEGFYLHTLIIFAFTNTKRLLIACYAIGWGFPVIPVAIYTGIRSQINESNQRCWINESEVNWVLSGPIGLSLVINFIFLINILRILLSKMRAVNSNEAHQTRRTVRATLILIPLLGLQYILIPFRPEGEKSQYIFNMVSAILTSYQGVFVALLFCFFNGEVLSLLHKKWREMIYVYNQEWRSNNTTLNATFVESTYIPRGTSKGSISKACSSSSSKGADELHLQQTRQCSYKTDSGEFDNGEV